MSSPARLCKLLTTLSNDADWLFLVSASGNRPFSNFVEVHFGDAKLFHVLLDHVLALLTY